MGFCRSWANQLQLGLPSGPGEPAVGCPAEERLQQCLFLSSTSGSWLLSRCHAYLIELRSRTTFFFWFCLLNFYKNSSQLTSLLKPYSLKCGPWAGCIDIPWELVRNAVSDPVTGPQIGTSISTSSPTNSNIHGSSWTTSLNDVIK